MNQGAGMARRLLHPQINASEQGASLSPCIHPRIQASEDSAGVTRRRRGKSPAEPVSLPDDDDMLREILLRLPPQPSSLPLAAAVCRRWRCIVGDPKFHRQFCAHHRKPPTLGVFERSHQGVAFIPILDPPDRIPPRRFSLGGYSRRWDYDVLDCRHGRVLVKDPLRRELVVCNPITGQKRIVAFPPDFRILFLHGAVLCAAGDHGHVHGDCLSSPFKVVLVSVHRHDNGSLACVYSSETGLWGNPISTEAPCEVIGKSAVLVGNCLYSLSISDVILKFDLDEQSLAMIRGPPDTNNFVYENRHVIRTEDDTVGFAILVYPCFQMWQRNVNCHGVATWVPWKTVEIHSILGLPPLVEGQLGGITNIQGYDEDTGVILICVDLYLYMVQLKSRQSKRLHETHHLSYYHPFTSFYTPGTAIAGRSNGAETLHNT